MKKQIWIPGKWACHDLTHTLVNGRRRDQARRAQIVADRAIARMIFNARYGYANNNR